MGWWRYISGKEQGTTNIDLGMWLMLKQDDSKPINCYKVSGITWKEHMKSCTDCICLGSVDCIQHNGKVMMHNTYG